VNLWQTTLWECRTKQIRDLNSFPLENQRRPLGHPRTMWMKTIQQDLKSNDLSLNEATDMAQNRPLWRRLVLHSPSGACQEWMNEWSHLSGWCRQARQPVQNNWTDLLMSFVVSTSAVVCCLGFCTENLTRQIGNSSLHEIQHNLSRTWSEPPALHTVQRNDQRPCDWTDWVTLTFDLAFRWAFC